MTRLASSFAFGHNSSGLPKRSAFQSLGGLFLCLLRFRRAARFRWRRVRHKAFAAHFLGVANHDKCARVGPANGVIQKADL